MSNVTWLADVLRNAGLKVVEQPGWKERGVGQMGEVRGIICHHTAGAKTGNAPSLNVVQNGRSDLRGPLSQLVLGRDGTFFVVASGACNHAGPGQWQGVTSGNTQMIGIEAENAGVSSDPWPDVQYDAYAKGCAAILRHLNLQPIMCCGHKEWALPKGRKPDPTFDMNLFRAKVSGLLGKPLPQPIQKVKVPQAKRDTTPAMRRRMAEWIMFNETGIQPNGTLKVIAPAVGDGGAYEVAGITEKHHPAVAAQLKELVELGLQEKAKQTIYKYYLDYTAPAAQWTNHAGVEAVLRDAGLHRGSPKGMARILQKAVRVDDDGFVGTDTLEAANRLAPEELIKRLEVARAEYEEEAHGHRAQFWQGFVNRWKRMTKWGLEMQKEQNSALPKVVKDTGASGTAGTAVGTGVAWLTGNVILGIVVGIVVFGVVLYFVIQSRKKVTV